MRNLNRTVDWLRPFVDSKVWDYCVVWKLGDDPSRFIEWMGCCCSGCGNVKVERGEQQLDPLCRDEYYQHPIRTKACEALAHFPLFMPLYSGESRIHGDVVISKQSTWLSHGSASDSNPSNEIMGTQVLIPVFGGLVELFSAKNIPKDQKIIKLITSHCNVSLEQKSITPHSYTNVRFNEQHLDPLLEENLQYFQSILHLSTLLPTIQFLTPTTQSNTHPSFDGSSSGSNPSYEQPSLDSKKPGYGSQNELLKQSVEKSFGSKRPRYGENLFNQQTGLVLNSNDKITKDNDKAIQMQGKEKYQSKNLVTERNRRNRIKDGLYTLRSLVPKISQMNRAAIIGDAIEYVGELQKEVKKLQDELREIEDEEHKVNYAEEMFLKPDGVHEGTTPATDHIQNCFGSNNNGKTEVHVEVNQIAKRDFLIKFFCEQKRGGFGRLMDAINSFGLQVVDANITTFSGKILNILKVEANKEDIQPKKLRDSLIKIASSVNQTVAENPIENEES